MLVTVFLYHSFFEVPIHAYAHFALFVKEFDHE